MLLMIKMNTLDIDPVARSTWEVPTFETPLWLGRKHRWCVVIPVINEGNRIRSLLAQMAKAQIASIADIIIVDGGSTDGSLELQYLQEQGVSGLLVKTGPGKLSSQLRCAYAFALDQGYQGIVSIDGNDKDDPRAIPNFITALEDGVDFVQASRFLPGGVAVNTPKSRDLAIRLIHAPALSFSSGFPWTDTTQGFRAYSRKMLLDPEINPFRDIFREYELLAYLSHRVPQMGFRCQELSTSRIYPEGEVPTKISAVRGNMKVLTTLLLACVGTYNVPGTTRRTLTSVRPLAIVCLIGFLYSVLAFFPGWMSPDSVAQYGDAKNGIYYDWHPVLMAWWWRHLDSLYTGPGLFLIQNLILYWGSWYLFSVASRRWLGRWALLIPFLGFWPGLLFPLGQIWKDIAFACSIFFSWALLFNAQCSYRKPRWYERLSIFILSIFAFGVKTNGVLVLPFLFWYWTHIEGWKRNNLFLRSGLCASLVLITTISATTLLSANHIIKTYPLQYTQTYDLLAISVKTQQNLLPNYINERIGNTSKELSSLYFSGGNNLLFYNAYGNIQTSDPVKLSDLNTRWLNAILEYPGPYLKHRLENFSALMRWKEKTTAAVASPTIVENPYNISYQSNKIADWLGSHTYHHPWMFFPWLYMLAMLGSMAVLITLNWKRTFVINLGNSALAFVLPHIFIAPAADYRYLYYSYFCTAILLFFSITELIRRFIFGKPIANHN
ncbi:glycosyltransferase family 2 protein [Alcaligenes aquatilis]